MNGNQEDAFEATVEDVTFRSADGRFSVLKVKRADDSSVTLVGDVGETQPGETIRVEGRWTDHATYGKRFRVASLVPILPSTAAGIARYLGSGLIAGIGPALAQRLVDRFGVRTLDVIATESARLRGVEGIGQKRALSISEAVRTRREEAEVLSYLHAVGVGPALGRRIIRAFGEETVRQVQGDPYAVAEKIAGMGFRTADRVGRAQGIGEADPRRAAGAVLHVVSRGTDDGHTFLPIEEVVSRAIALDVPEACVRETITALGARGQLKLEDEAVYAPPLFRAESAVAADFARLAKAPPPRSAAEVASLAKPSTHVALSETQWDAVRTSVLHRLVVLTGGPGTGKTTTVRAIIDAQRAIGNRVVLGAPTGRAAKRLSDATGCEAKTLHRLLEWNPATGRFLRDRAAPLEAEFILIDETSMLDVQLAERLLAAVPTSATLMLVGDADQLPPVGPGQVLRALIASGLAPVVRLTEIFRQAQRSAIVRGAHSILHGDLPEASEPGASDGGDLFFVRAREPDQIVERVVATMTRIEKAYGLDPKRDVQVLTPMRRGPLGTEELNRVLQNVLNPALSDSPATGFRPKDKVMQLRNDYEREVYNGDLGEVSRIEGGITYVLVDGREVQYSTEAADALTLAYASTIHKVQGSEFPAVVVVLHTSQFMLLSRALLYTAVTRAQKLVVIVGDERALRRAVTNADPYATNSRLRARLDALGNGDARLSF